MPEETLLPGLFLRKEEASRPIYQEGKVEKSGLQEKEEEGLLVYPTRKGEREERELNNILVATARVRESAGAAAAGKENRSQALWVWS